MADQLVFTMTERSDRNGQKYLFGSMKMFNVVVFIYPAETGVPGEYKGVIKPFTGTRSEEEFSFG